MQIKGFEKATCPSCGCKMIIEGIKGRTNLIGVCISENCNKNWFLTLGVNDDEIIAREAKKIGNLNDLGYKGPKGLNVFEVTITNFKFHNEKFYRENKKKDKTDWSKVKFIPHIENIEVQKIWNNKNKRNIDFHFKLETTPNIIEISFNGQCSLESPEQKKIDINLIKHL